MRISPTRLILPDTGNSVLCDRLEHYRAAQTLKYLGKAAGSLVSSHAITDAKLRVAPTGRQSTARPPPIGPVLKRLWDSFDQSLVRIR